MNPGIEFEFAFLWNVVGQILILCRTCMMRKWSSIKTKTKPLGRPGKKAVAKSKHCRWILMPCCPISGKWGATRLIHLCFMAKHCQINLHLIFETVHTNEVRVRWRFRKILWPSQNIWTLLTRYLDKAENLRSRDKSHQI